MTTWDSSFETVPADNDSISAGAGVIRTLKTAIRERLDKDHYMELDGTGQDHGEHCRVMFQAPLEDTPSTAVDKGVLFTRDVDGKAELHWKDEDGNVLQITSAGVVNVDLTGPSILNPPGAVAAFMAASAPGGWLECNGAAVSRETYADLFAVISTMYGVGDGSTTFNLPDLRGYFLRGWNHGAGVDPDASSRTDRGDGTNGDYVGTVQEDELESHVHDIENVFVSSIGADGYPRASMVMTGAALETESTGGNETRPKNIAVLYCIKT